MLAVYGQRDDARLEEIRAVMHDAGIPCVLIGPEFGFASMAERLPFVCFLESGAPCDVGLRQKTGKDKILHVSADMTPEEIAASVRTAYRQRFGADMDLLHGGGIRFEGRQVYFRGHLLHLTAAEYRIVRLLFHSRGCYFTEEEIAAACLSDPCRKAAVHICNINKKSRFVLDLPLIETRRYSGYRIPQEK